ncbi:unnamed protein product [Mycena citricolor]|uniref:Major facilitator superfamily (MFS) profile domain-containing protein n=1 Tax=Mycena citricolor TaxID=2018698 RepID=A0AAD2JX54_9AGAR|nr:unnamed protein product [Mycena citricolor]
MHDLPPQKTAHDAPERATADDPKHAQLHEHGPPRAKPEPTAHQAAWGRVQTAALCVPVFLAGWNDGTLGPLLPRIQAEYGVGYLVASLPFVCGAVGSIIGAFLTITMTPRLGFGKMLLLAPIAQLVGYSLQAAALPYPVFALCATLNSISTSILDAQANGYVASFARHAETRMGYVQAAYGAGLFAAPLVSTQFARLPRWSFHYLVSLGLALLNWCLVFLVFRGRTQDECLARIGQPVLRVEGKRDSQMRQLFGMKGLHILAAFLFVHVGVGVAIGGWTVTYMVDTRGGGSSAGYIAAGFSGGAALGRIALVWVNNKVGANRVVYIYALAAIGLQLVVWLVHSLVGGALAVAFVGLVSGPIYPLALNRAAKIFPPSLLTASMGWMAAIATVGGALVPFIAGAISSRAGIKSLQPIIVAMMVLMLCLWPVVPRRMTVVV